MLRENQFFLEQRKNFCEGQCSSLDDLPSRTGTGRDVKEEAEEEVQLKLDI